MPPCSSAPPSSTATCRSMRLLHSCGAFLSSDIFGRSARPPTVRADESAGRNTRSDLSWTPMVTRFGSGGRRARDWRFREDVLRLGNDRREPDLRNIPAAIRFLGFDWRRQGASLGERIRQARTAVGLSITQLAELLEVNPSAVEGWEHGLHMPSRRSAAKLAEWLSPTAGPDLTIS